MSTTPTPETDQGLPLVEPQTAIHPADKPDGEMPSPLASLTAEAVASPVSFHKAESDRRMRVYALSKARQTGKHGAASRRNGFHQAFGDGAIAHGDLARHMYRSLPARSPSTPSILQKLRFSIHFAVAELALRQAQKAAHRLGLKRIGDTTGFVSDHCGWYMSFCKVMGWIDRVAVKLENLKARG